MLNAHATDELLELAEVGPAAGRHDADGEERLPGVARAARRLARDARPEVVELRAEQGDVVVAVGARFDDRVTGKVSAFAPGATVVHLDIDAAEISKIRHADIPVVGPLKPVLASLAKTLATSCRARAHRRRGFARSREWREQFPLGVQRGSRRRC